MRDNWAPTLIVVPAFLALLQIAKAQKEADKGQCPAQEVDQVGGHDVLSGLFGINLFLALQRAKVIIAGGSNGSMVGLCHGPLGSTIHAPALNVSAAKPLRKVLK